MGVLLVIIRLEGTLARCTHWGGFLLAAQRTAEALFCLQNGYSLDACLWALYYTDAFLTVPEVAEGSRFYGAPVVLGARDPWS